MVYIKERLKLKYDYIRCFLCSLLRLYDLSGISGKPALFVYFVNYILNRFLRIIIRLGYSAVNNAAREALIITEVQI